MSELSLTPEPGFDYETNDIRDVSGNRGDGFFSKQYRDQIKPFHSRFGPGRNAARLSATLERKMGKKLQKEEHVIDVLFPNSLARWGFEEFLLDVTNRQHHLWGRARKGLPCSRKTSVRDCSSCISRVYRFYYTHPDIVCWRQKVNGEPTVLASFTVLSKNSIRVNACCACSESLSSCPLSTIHRWNLTLDEEGVAKKEETQSMATIGWLGNLLEERNQVAIREEELNLLGLQVLEDTDIEDGERIIRACIGLAERHQELMGRVEVLEGAAKIKAMQFNNLLERDCVNSELIDGLKKENQALQGRLKKIEAHLGYHVVATPASTHQ